MPNPPVEDSPPAGPPISRAQILSPEEVELALAHINGKASGGDPCQVCGSTESAIQPDLVVTDVWPERWVEGKKPALISVVTICENCGFTRLFNATVVGILPKGQLYGG